MKTQSLHNDSPLNGLKPSRKGEKNANASPPKNSYAEADSSSDSLLSIDAGIDCQYCRGLKVGLK